MPIISVFFGMIIRIFHSDHNPPHIHVQYGEFEATVDIKTGDILHGKIPPRLYKILREWLRLRRSDVLSAWQEARQHKMPRRIKPME